VIRRILRLFAAAVAGALLVGCASLGTTRPGITPQDYSAPRSFTVDGSGAPIDWLVEDSGVIRVHGYMNNAMPGSSPGRLLLDIVVRQDFAGLTVFHVLPALGDGKTIVVDGGKSARLPADAGDDGRLLVRYFDATLSVRDGSLYVDRLVMSERAPEWNGANNYTEYPPESDVYDLQLLKESAGSSWMDLDTSAESEVVGYVSTTDSGEDEDGIFKEGSFDVVLPDRMGSVRIQHVVRIAVPDGLMMREIGLSDEAGPESFSVRLENGRLVLSSAK